ncbi:SH3 domain-containing protein [Phenylobacterium sp. J426]|uniref:SH3 domain-containing protein n=1 Tax=Phenylobacterium sp. J426 TaxID=2898439 RepID=UPI00215103F5|nr:SH3 domain-containing protein [Phenylobacterium sp. J426]MCR5876198.1 SH3 domain-containing protein [Phenylobacterium sp. J426]
MRNVMKTSIGGGAAAALLAGVLALGGATTASAGVTGCSASGGKQEVGAVLGAVVGGLVGNKVGGRQPGLETVVGAGVGAAAGSAIGCEMQKDRVENRGTYTRGGYRLSSDIAPAAYSRIGQTFVATDGVNVRAAPTTSSARVGRLRAGERFEALAHVRGTDWILVGQGGVGVGYVRDDFVRPEGRRYARGY